jgi:SulP family sulfate permease
VVSFIPLSALAAVLIIVALNISEVERFRNLMNAPTGDRVVLLTTFLLTVFVDLSTAIRIGIIMAALLFMHRMAELVDIDTALSWLHDRSDEDDGPEDQPTAPVPAALPKGIEVYQISGPFFFGAAARVVDELDYLRKRPKVLILRMRDVPMMDASGAAALKSICEKVMRNGGETILSSLQSQPRRILESMGILGKPTKTTVTPDFRQALAEAKARLTAS